MGVILAKSNRIEGPRLELNRQVFSCGDIIEGIIHFSLSEEIPPSILEILFKGKEKIYWRLELIDESKYLKYEKCYECHLKYIVMKWDHSILPGVYRIPFKFKTQKCIAGSFKYNDYLNSAYVCYTILAKLYNEKKCFKGKMNVRMINIPTTLKQNVSLAKNIYWCHSEKGNLEFALKLLKDTFSNNEPIEFFVDIDNTNGSLAVSKIAAKLSYCLRIRNNYDLNEIKKNLRKKKYSVNVNPREKLDSNTAKFSIDLGSISNNIINIHSVQTNKIQCIFFLKVKIIVRGSCKFCIKENTIELPIIIAPALVIEHKDQPNAIVQPPGWNPNIYDIVDLEFDSKYEVRAPEDPSEDKDGKILICKNLNKEKK
ncbi:hypothetical protein SteCoe_16988 [Stentor coeruleus]|uniref:Arrestin C-terminal-like domain-containing protein n=1 Tax=Stentor coeruleus TaxID=5963 RepID=A0A1R2BZZ9_9CILI|nr:hypothetical protein SteCoe_16988 [Stentor coeruleus]